MKRKNPFGRPQPVRTDRVGLGAAIPMVFIVAFGTALANHIGAATIDALVEVTEPIVEYIEDVLD